MISIPSLQGEKTSYTFLLLKKLSYVSIIAGFLHAHLRGQGVCAAEQTETEQEERNKVREKERDR